MASRPKPDEDIKTPEGLIGLPATYVDTVFCNYWTDHVRISFAETIDGNSYFRSAVVMETPAVRNLIETLQEVLTDMEAQRQIKAEPIKPK